MNRRTRHFGTWSFDRTYEELKLCLRRSGKNLILASFDRTYEELKHGTYDDTEQQPD